MKAKERELIQRAKAVPIVDVVGRYLSVKKKGPDYLALCPFHGDRRLGSFVISEKKGRFTCYSCGEKGDVIDFVSKIEGINMFDAARKILGEEAANPNLAPIQVKRKKRLKKKDPEYLSKVYEAFVRSCPELSKSHLEIIKGWGLEDFSQGKEYFFEFPKESQAFWNRFGTELRKAGIREKNERLRYSLDCVPGFYFDRSEKKCHFIQYEGIGIIERDEFGRISGLQIRSDKPSESRYKMFSSGFADTADAEETKVHGASIEEVADIVLGDPLKRFVITEGKKKALILKKERNVSVLSLNGVNAVRPVPDFLELARTAGHKVVLIAFDADAREKKSVRKAALHLADIIEEAGLTPKFLVWDGNFGKGIDDFFNNPSKDKGGIREISRAKFEEL